MKVPSNLYTCLGTRKPSLQWSLKYPYTLKGKKRTVKNGTLYPHHITITHIGRSKSFVTRGRCVFVLSRYCCLKFVSFCTNVRRNIVTSCSRKIVDLVPKSSLTSATAYFFLQWRPVIYSVTPSQVARRNEAWRIPPVTYTVSICTTTQFLPPYELFIKRWGHLSNVVFKYFLLFLQS